MISRVKQRVRRLLQRRVVLPPVDSVADANWYDAAYSATKTYYSAPYWESDYYFLWSVLADRIRTAKARSVIDIGCGPGQFAACLFGLTSIERYTGLDFSEQAVAMARRVCPQGNYFVGDATTTTIHADTQHDLVVCSEVLEHVPGDLGVIERFKPGVRCICTVPNFPYVSHVRHFTSVAEVCDRYGHLFHSPDVWVLRKSGKQVYYVLDGVRK